MWPIIVEALTRVRTAMPFPLLGFDTDNGGAFINEVVLAYCTTTGIDFTPARPHRKNDHAWVEQKNGSVVRRLVGYRRLEGLAASDALARRRGSWCSRWTRSPRSRSDPERRSLCDSP